MFATSMAATITYPLAVRVARSRLFKLRNFYSIHLAIAPFLAFAHVNIYAVFQTLTKIKVKECKDTATPPQSLLDEYNEYMEKKSKNVLEETKGTDFGKSYYELKRLALDRTHN